MEHPSSRLFFAREQSSAGTLIGKVSAVDKDKDDKLSFEITGKKLFHSQLITSGLDVSYNIIQSLRSPEQAKPTLSELSLSLQLIFNLFLAPALTYLNWWCISVSLKLILMISFPFISRRISHNRSLVRRRSPQTLGQLRRFKLYFFGQNFGLG